MECFTGRALISHNVQETKVMEGLSRLKRATCNGNRGQLWWSYHWWKEDELMAYMEWGL
jgi:hypothetical protein